MSEPRVDPVRLLLRALRLSAREAGCVAALVHEKETPWCSATFVGAQHQVAVAGAGEAFAGWIAALPEAELPVRGHLVADCVVERRRGGALLTLLVLEA